MFYHGYYSIILNLNLRIAQKIIMKEQAMITKFIWRNKTGRIKAEIMQQAVSRGGLGV